MKVTSGELREITGCIITARAAFWREFSASCQPFNLSSANKPLINNVNVLWKCCTLLFVFIYSFITETRLFLCDGWLLTKGPSGLSGSRPVRVSRCYTTVNVLAFSLPLSILFPQLLLDKSVSRLQIYPLRGLMPNASKCFGLFLCIAPPFFLAHILSDTMGIETSLTIAGEALEDGKRAVTLIATASITSPSLTRSRSASLLADTEWKCRDILLAS